MVKSGFPDLSLSKDTLASHLLKRCLNFKDRTAVILGHNGNKYSYQEIYNGVLDCIGFLQKYDIKRGDVVALVLPNMMEYVMMFMAAAACNATLTLCNPLYTARELEHQFRDSKPKLIFISAHNAKELKNVAQEFDFVKDVIVLGEGGDFEVDTTGNRSQNVQIPEATLDIYKDTQCLPYSSGTTGKPKGVMQSSHSLLTSLISIRSIVHIFPYDVIYCVLPMFHMSGLLMAFTALEQGGQLLLENRFSLERMAELTSTYKVTILPTVPPILLMLAKSDLHKKYDMSSLRMALCGAAPVAPDIAKTISNVYGIAMLQGYGMTETAGISLMGNDQWGTPYTSTGVLTPMLEGKIVDVDTEKDLGPNVVGELWMKGPTIMLGYHNNEAATLRTITPDGWLRTGDLGYYDEHNQFYIVDRLKELIKYKAFQVAPAELEALLLSHEGVADAAVIGIPDDEAGEVPKAFVVKKDPKLTAEDVKALVKGELSSYKQLRGGVEFLKEIPKSQAGKILRRVLRDQHVRKSPPASKL